MFFNWGAFHLATSAFAAGFSRGGAIVLKECISSRLFFNNKEHCRWSETFSAALSVPQTLLLLSQGVWKCHLL